MKDRSGGDSARLGMSDQAVCCTTGVQTDLRKLSRLSRSGFPAEDDDLILHDCARNLFTPRYHRKVLRILRHRTIEVSRVAVHGVRNGSEQKPEQNPKIY
jgi:hypothetical protein